MRLPSDLERVDHSRRITTVNEHLGGYVKGGDPATFYPVLWEWLITRKHIKSVLDVGCGEGVALEFFLKHGVLPALGVDGVPQKNPNIITHDFTKGTLPISPTLRFDLCWSCEFVEHVEEEFVPNFLDAFRRADLVLMTHATPGQGGYHHVNCRDSEYWRGAMAAIGYTFDAPITAITRSLASMNTNPWNHYVRSGMAFVPGSLGDCERASKIPS